jgi:hypothetical protein
LNADLDFPKSAKYFDSRKQIALTWNLLPSDLS